MENGYIRLYRKLLEWEWIGDPNVLVVFIHLLLLANFKEKKWMGITIKRGSLITGRLELAVQTHLTQMQIRTALTKLKSTNEITIKTTNRYSIVTIQNYDQYQSDNQQHNQQITNKQPTDNQQITTTNNVKNDKNDKNDKKERAHTMTIEEKNALITQMTTQFPDKDVQGEIEKMYDWCLANGKKYIDYSAFARNWLRRTYSDDKKETVGAVRL